MLSRVWDWCEKKIEIWWFYSPSEGIWPLKLCVNPDVLLCQLSLLLSASSRIPEIIFKPKRKKVFASYRATASSFSHIHSKYLEGWPGTPYQWPLSPEQEHFCNCETLQLPGSSAWAGGIFWTSPTLHRSQSQTPPAAAPNGNTPELSPLHYWLPVRNPDTIVNCVVPGLLRPLGYAKYSGTHFEQLHNGGIFRVIGIQSWLCSPLPNFFHVI